MSVGVKSVSYLVDDSRRVVEVNPRNGRFMLRWTVLGKYGSSREVQRDFSLFRFVTHEMVKDSDPVLTLDSGEKMRVYHGASSSQMLSIAAGIIEKHDKTQTIKKSKSYLKNKVKKSHKLSDSRKSTDDYDFLSSFDFDDDDYDFPF